VAWISIGNNKKKVKMSRQFISNLLSSVLSTKSWIKEIPEFLLLASNLRPS